MGFLSPVERKPRVGDQIASFCRPRGVLCGTPARGGIPIFTCWRTSKTLEILSGAGTSRPLRVFQSAALPPNRGSSTPRGPPKSTSASTALNAAMEAGTEWTLRSSRESTPLPHKLSESKKYKSMDGDNLTIWERVMIRLRISCFLCRSLMADQNRSERSLPPK